MNRFKKRIPQILSRSFGTKFFFISLTALFATACNESSVVGLDVQPASDLLNVGWQDTTTLITTTVKEDSLHTDASIIVGGDALLGTYLDPVFGRTSASFYTQLRLLAGSPTFGTGATCDSVVLSMVYAADFYGKKERKPQRISIYQLSETMSTTADYYSNNSLSYTTNDLAGGFVYTPEPTTKVVILGDTLRPQLRVRLQPYFGTVILNQAGLPTVSANTNFQNFTKGLYITSDVTTSTTGDGNISHFKMSDLQSKLTVYYHNNTNDSLKYDISLSAVARFSAFRHDYTTGDPYLNAELASSATTDTTVFVQALAGVKGKIEFPYLLHMKDSGKIAINRAELVIKVDNSSPLYQVDTFAAPTKLVLFGITSSNTNFAIPDAYESNESFGGSYDASAKEYHFNIDRYIQQVLNGTQPNSGLYMVASGGAVTSNRAVLGSGSSKGAQKMKLNITYTKLH